MSLLVHATFVKLVVIPALVGLGIGLMVTPESVDAHLDGLVHVKAYTYKNNSCVDGNEVDPVSVVMYWNATTANVETHGDHHGFTNHDGPETSQRFYQHGCIATSGGEATPLSWDGDRYHFRHRWHTDPSEAWLGNYSIATPHYDQGVACNWHEPGHAVAVPSEWSWAPSGFVAGKWEYGQRFHNWGSGPHYFMGSQFWDNQVRIQQCNGQWHGNDGWVDFVKID
jgi:hypothetical protein